MMYRTEIFVESCKEARAPHSCSGPFDFQVTYYVSEEECEQKEKKNKSQKNLEKQI